MSASLTKPAKAQPTAEFDSGTFTKGGRLKIKPTKPSALRAVALKNEARLRYDRNSSSVCESRRGKYFSPADLTASSPDRTSRARDQSKAFVSKSGCVEFTGIATDHTTRFYT